jgi:transcriptional regulator with XRE-family HTH domain
MGRRPAEQTKVETKLAAWRTKRQITQAELAEAVGISLTAYRRLERGQRQNPQLRQLMNCAIALGCELEDLLDDSYRAWYPFDQRHAQPPEHAELWRRPYKP